MTFTPMSATATIATKTKGRETGIAEPATSMNSRATAVNGQRVNSHSAS
jgi:hypothetical protein